MRVAILKFNSVEDRYYNDQLWCQGAEWLDLTEEQVAYLKANVHKLNTYPVTYTVVESVPQEEVGSMFEQLTAILDMEARQAAERAVRNKAAHEKRKATELENKRKKLEQLKKELGET